MFFLNTQLRNGQEIEAEADTAQGALLPLTGVRKLKGKADLGDFTASDLKL